MIGKKGCQIDRGKLLIGLEVCRREAFAPCNGCQYGTEDTPSCFEHLAEDALAYIGWLEEQMEEK